jgi:hypothetical protein
MCWSDLQSASFRLKTRNNPCQALEVSAACRTYAESAEKKRRIVLHAQPDEAHVRDGKAARAYAAS